MAGRVDVAIAATVTAAVPLAPPLEPITVNGPPVAAPAGKRPPGEIVPPPRTLHANPGCGASGAPNWSTATAANCCVPPGMTVALDGLTATPVSVWLTVTVTELVAVCPSASVTVAARVYVPAFENVAVLFFAAFVPFGLNV